MRGGGQFIVIVFYYFIASEICPDKRGGSPLRGESLLSLYFTISLHQKSVLKRGVVSLEGGGGGVYCHCILLFHYIRYLS